MPKPAPIGHTRRYVDDGLGQFAIGQRAILLQTPDGNVLWDLISLIDQPLREFIERLGGLDAIVISHPHFYTTYVEWADRFSCPVYMAADDQEWMCRKPSDSTTIKLIEEASETILPGVTAIKAGGHFPGSLVLHWEDQLFIADTIMTVPSAHSPHPRPPGQVSYSFQWSIPNMIPLGLNEITHIWDAIRPYDFHTTYGAFNGMTVRDQDLKRRVFDSMVIQLSKEGVKNASYLLTTQ
ncbi:MAG: hypothetical protein LQ344_000234 [Seirophora lacunosa]|nr:MAG: hypothetical protein LQ344_000234 [Seirophora lacunosa]